MTSHLLNSCMNQQGKCAKCNEALVRSNLNAHECREKAIEKLKDEYKTLKEHSDEQEKKIRERDE